MNDVLPRTPEPACCVDEVREQLPFAGFARRCEPGLERRWMVTGRVGAA